MTPVEAGKVGVPNCDHGTDSCRERRTAIEAKPPKPNQYGAEEDNGDVVGLIDVLFVIAATLAENKSVRQPGRSR